MNKKIVMILVFFVAIIISFENVYATPASSYFKDDNFYNCVIDAYNKENNSSLPYSTSLTKPQLSKITTLDCSNKNISDIFGLWEMENLVTVNLSNNNLTGTIPISLLNEKLSNLNLANNQITYVDISAGTKIRTIILSNNKIQRFTSSLTYLQSLYLDNNELNTISLASYTGLGIAVLNNNKLTSITANSKNMYALEANNNLISNVDVSNCPNLAQLELSNNKISSIDLSNNTKIQKLLLDNNDISLFNPSDFTYLEQLNISNTKIVNPSFSNNTRLQRLEAAGLSINNFNYPNMTELNYLNLKNNNLTSINLGLYPKLTNIYLSENDLKEIDYRKLNTTIIADTYYQENSKSIFSNPLKKVFFGEKTRLTSSENVYSKMKLSIDPDYAGKKVMFIFPLGMTLDKISNNVFSGSFKIKEKNGTVISSYDFYGLLAKTGMTIENSPSNMTSTSNNIVITGDITGTGNVTVADVAKLYQYLKGKITMDDIYIVAGNVVHTDEEIKINDVAKLYQYVRGKINSLD